MDNMKNFKNNNKIKNGFTLIELLATIVILGIITAMAFPMLRRISEDNMNRKLKTYANSVESSAKLYVDSYGEDLFGRDKSGIVYVTYDELKSKSLIKDISDNDISCNSSKTIVKITKIDDAYTYDVQLGCTNSKNSDGSNLIIFPKNSNLKCETSSTTLKYDLNVSPGKYTDNDKNRSAVTVTLSSDTGINNKYNEIYYSWTLNPNNGNDTWNKLNFDIPSADQQKKDLILNKISEVVVKKQLILPEKTGKWYLKIEVRSLQNAAGDNLLTEKQNKQYGPYTIDRDKPTINGVTISSKDSSYNSKAVNVVIEATDNDKYAAVNDLQYCITEDNKSCSGYGKSNNIEHNFSGSYDGKARKLYVWVKDRAGNKTSLSDSSYVVYKECSETKALGNWTQYTSCTAQCGDSGTRTLRSNVIDKYFNTSCSGYTYKYNDPCNRRDCCSSTYESAGGWSGWSSCSKSCGGGTQTRTRTITSISNYNGQSCGNRTDTGTQSCNTQNCCSSTHESAGGWSGWSSCSKSCGGGTQTRTRTITSISNYNGQSCGNRTDTGTQSCNTQSCCVPVSISGRYASIYPKSVKLGGDQYFYYCNYNISGSASGLVGQVCYYNYTGDKKCTYHRNYSDGSGPVSNGKTRFGYVQFSTSVWKYWRYSECGYAKVKNSCTNDYKSKLVCTS